MGEQTQHLLAHGIDVTRAVCTPAIQARDRFACVCSIAHVWNNAMVVMSAGCCVVNVVINVLTAGMQ